MKILYFHHGIWPSASPSTGFVTNNLQGLVEAGADVRLLTVRNRRQPVGETLMEAFGMPPDLPVSLLNCGWMKRRHAFIYLMALRWMWNHPFDVLITRNLAFLPWANALRRTRRFRLIFEAHDFFGRPDLLPDASRRTRQTRLERTWVPHTDGVITVSSGLAQRFAERYPGIPVVAARTGIRIAGGVVPHSRMTRRVCFTGTFFNGNYNIGLLLDAIGPVTGLTLTLAGCRSAGEEEMTRAMVRARGLENRVEVRRWMTPGELGAMMDECDFGLSPLNDTFFTSFIAPTKIMDYLSRGLPVLSTDLPSIRDLFGNGSHGILLPPEASDWAQALETLYERPGEYPERSVSALQAAREGSWANRARVMLDFLSR